MLLRVLYFAEIRIQSFEALLPVAAVLTHPAGDFPQRTRLKPSWSPLRLAPLLDEPGPFEYAKVLGDGGLTHVEGCRQVLDGGLAFGEPGKDRPPGRIGEGGERRAEGIGLLHVHYCLVI